MAEVKLDAPFLEIHGALGKESPYYYRHRKGKTYLCCKPGVTIAMRNGRAPYKSPKPKAVTPAQKQMRERFKMLVQAANEVCSCPTLKAYFEDAYRHDRKARGTLQAYVMRRINPKRSGICSE